MSCLVMVRRCMLWRSPANCKPRGSILEAFDQMEEGFLHERQGARRSVGGSGTITGQFSHGCRGAREYRAIMPSENTSIQDVNELEELLSEPTDGTIRALAALDGDIIVLGVGGKMGPTLARMAKRASEMAGVKRRVIGVSRFSSSALEQQLRAWSIETVRCDLLDRKSLADLPDATNVVYMAGMKFGSQATEPTKCAMNRF